MHSIYARNFLFSRWSTSLSIIYYLSLYRENIWSKFSNCCFKMENYSPTFTYELYFIITRVKSFFFNIEKLFCKQSFSQIVTQYFSILSELKYHPCKRIYIYIYIYDLRGMCVCVCLCVYIYIYMICVVCACVCVCVYIYIYIYVCVWSAWYVRVHVCVCVCVHWELYKRLTFDQTTKCYMLKRKSVLENKSHRILWYFEIQTIQTKRPNQMFIYQKK